MTSPFRVTERSIATSSLFGMQANLARLGEVQQRMSSGKTISKPSDSPAGTLAAMQLRSSITQQNQYALNADDGKGWLGATDSALTSGIDLAQQVRGFVLQGMSAGAGDSPAARQTLATQVDNLRQSMLGIANSGYLGRPLFGGTTAGTAAYDANGGYVGDSGTVLRTLSGSDQVRVDTPGPATFGTGSAQIFTVLSSISSDLRSNPSALAGDLASLDTTTLSMQGQLADVGARYNRLGQLGQAATDRAADLHTQLSGVEDIDLPKTIMELQLQQTAYQAALGATAKAIQPSLLDFLR